MTIDEMNLEPTAKTAAKSLLSLHPSIVFTSGRRTVHQQASAMASNIVASANRKWIQQTYAATSIRDALQKWVDENPVATTQDALTQGLEGAMSQFGAAELGRLSKHLGGLAFDVQPIDPDTEGVKDDMKTLPGLTKFLDVEGGLIRWHAQF